MNTLCVLAGLAALAVPGVAGDVTIHAEVTKKLTRKTLSPTVYSLRGTAPPAAPESSPVTEFSQMVIVLEGTSNAAVPPATVSIGQKAMKFEPDLVVIPVGSTVQFPNEDPIFHSVFSLSRVKPFDLGYYAQGQSRTVKFDRAGIVQVYCHLHAGMYAAIVVTPSQWYGKPAEDGSISFSDVPAGHYRVLAWHKIAGLHQTETDVPAAGKTEVKIRVPIDVEPRK